jgi:hypothetical protein
MKIMKSTYQSGKFLERFRNSYMNLCEKITTFDATVKKPNKRKMRMAYRRNRKFNMVMARKTQTTPKTKQSTKSKITQSLISRGNIFCVNQMKNDTPYWGGQTCDSYTSHHGDIIQWVCSSCVAKMMPAPEPRYEPKRDPITGEKRKRGRPRKNPMKVIQLDENGHPIKGKRGRPKGTKNKSKINQ